jgi:hypothetical protein
MHRRAIVVALFVTAAGAAQLHPQASPAGELSSRKAQRETEIMSGILQTTLKFAAKENGERSQFEPPEAVRGYYLHDQGAVFLVPLPGLPHAENLAVIYGSEVEFAEQAELLEGAVVLRRSEGSPDEARHAEEWRENRKRRKEEAEERLKAYRNRIAAATKQLIAALANHGDSMTLLADEQYINLILTTGPRHAWPVLIDEAPSGPRVPEAQVVSVKRSWIRDYKAGRISLAQLEAKVLRY